MAAADMENYIEHITMDKLDKDILKQHSEKLIVLVISRYFENTELHINLRTKMQAIASKLKTELVICMNNPAEDDDEMGHYFRTRADPTFIFIKNNRVVGSKAMEQEEDLEIALSNHLPNTDVNYCAKKKIAELTKRFPKRK